MLDRLLTLQGSLSSPKGDTAGNILAFAGMAICIFAIVVLSMGNRKRVSGKPSLAVAKELPSDDADPAIKPLESILPMIKRRLPVSDETPVCYLPGNRDDVRKVFVRGNILSVEAETGIAKTVSTELPGSVAECLVIPGSRFFTEAGDLAVSFAITTVDRQMKAFSVVRITKDKKDGSIGFSMKSNHIDGASRIVHAGIDMDRNAMTCLVLADDAGGRLFVLDEDMNLANAIDTLPGQLFDCNASLSEHFMAYDGSQLTIWDYSGKKRLQGISETRHDIKGDLSKSFFSGYNHQTWFGSINQSTLSGCVLYDGENVLAMEGSEIFATPLPSVMASIGHTVFIADDGVYFAFKPMESHEFIVQKIFTTRLKPLLYSNIMHEEQEIAVFLEECPTRRLHLVVIGLEYTKHLALSDIAGDIIDCTVTTEDDTLIIHTSAETVEIERIGSVGFRPFWKPVAIEPAQTGSLDFSLQASAGKDGGGEIYTGPIFKTDSIDAVIDDFDAGLMDKP